VAAREGWERWHGMSFVATLLSKIQGTNCGWKGRSGDFTEVFLKIAKDCADEGGTGFLRAGGWHGGGEYG
jgi:hypothetical protein